MRTIGVVLLFIVRCPLCSRFKMGQILVGPRNCGINCVLKQTNTLKIASKDFTDKPMFQILGILFPKS